MRWCTVTVTDQDGRRHSIDVQATSTFDAAHLAGATSVVPTVEVLGVRRIGFDAPTMTAAMKCFKTVTAVAASAVEGLYG